MKPASTTKRSTHCIVKPCSQRGFTMIELLVVISIIGLLIALLLSALQTARYTAKLSQCQSNLRQIGVGLVNYATDERGKFPYHWFRQSVGSGTTLHRYPYIFRDWGMETGFHRNYMNAVGRDAFFCPASLDKVLAQAGSDQRRRTYMNWPSRSPGGNFAEITYAYYAGETINRNNGDTSNGRKGPDSFDVESPSKSTMLADLARFNSSVTTHIEGTHWNHNDGDPRLASNDGNGPLNVSDQASVAGVYVDGHVEMISGRDEIFRHGKVLGGQVAATWVAEQPGD